MAARVGRLEGRIRTVETLIASIKWNSPRKLANGKLEKLKLVEKLLSHLDGAYSLPLAFLSHP